MADFGIKFTPRVWTDSSASIGMCSQQGLGKARHLDTQAMWIQQRVRTGDIDLYKVLGSDNPADVFTKASIPADRMDRVMHNLGCSGEEGRADTATALRRRATEARVWGPDS